MSDPIDELAKRRERGADTRVDDLSIQIGWQYDTDGSRVVAFVDHDLRISILMNAAQARACAKLLYDAAEIIEAPEEPKL